MQRAATSSAWACLPVPTPISIWASLSGEALVVAGGTGAQRTSVA